MKQRAIFVSVATLSMLLFNLGGCSKSDHEPIRSPSGTYEVHASVDATNKQSRNYGIVMLHLSGGSGVDSLPTRTGAGTFQKWALGWMPGDDTLVLYSADIGTLAYFIENDRLTRLETLSSEIHQRADELYQQKYGQAPRP